MKLMRRLAAIGPPLMTVAVLIAGWQLVVRVAQLPARLLPTPSAVLARLEAGIFGGDMLGEIAHSIVAVTVGYAVACLAALIMALISTESRRAERLLYPLVAAFQAIPKVALAPLVILWTGFGLRSEIILIAMIAFFPIFANAFIGLSSVNRELGELFRVYDGGRLFRIIHLSCRAPLVRFLPGCRSQSDSRSLVASWWSFWSAPTALDFSFRTRPTRSIPRPPLPRW
jgi:NitT/TauT family transport system permease protein